jgi:hypothetical protein
MVVAGRTYTPGFRQSCTFMALLPLIAGLPDYDPSSASPGSDTVIYSVAGTFTSEQTFEGSTLKVQTTNNAAGSANLIITSDGAAGANTVSFDNSDFPYLNQVRADYFSNSANFDKGWLGNIPLEDPPDVFGIQSPTNATIDITNARISPDWAVYGLATNAATTPQLVFDRGATVKARIGSAKSLIDDGWSGAIFGQNVVIGPEGAAGYDSGASSRNYMQFEHEWDSGVTPAYTTHALTGTLTVNGTAAVTGSGTAFTTELRAGDAITINSIQRAVASIASNTALTLSSAHPSSGAYSATTGRFTLTGTVTVSAGGTAVTGSGTAFLSQLAVGGRLITNSESHIISAIASNTALTLANAHQAGASGATGYTGGLRQNEAWIGVGDYRALQVNGLQQFPNTTFGSMAIPMVFDINAANTALSLEQYRMARFSSTVSDGNTPVVSIQNYSTSIPTMGLDLKGAGATNNPWFSIWANPNALNTSNAEANSFGIWDRTAGAIRFYISSSGNIGIGNTAPTSKLDVTGTATATAFIGPLTGNVTGDVTGSVSGNAGTVTVANEAVDTTNFLVFANSATGANALKSNAGLAFNAATGTLSVTSLSATTGAVTLSPTTAALTIFPTFGSGAIDNCTIGANYPNYGTFAAQTGGSYTFTGATGSAIYTMPAASATMVSTTTLNNATLPISGTTGTFSGTLSANTIALASGTTATLFNTTATTVNAFGAATAVSIGASTGTTTINHRATVQSITTPGSAVTDLLIKAASGNSVYTVLAMEGRNGGGALGTAWLINSVADGFRMNPRLEILDGTGGPGTGNFIARFLSTGCTLYHSASSVFTTVSGGVSCPGTLAVTGATTLNGNVAIGNATTDLVGFYGATAVDQPATVADPSGGAIIDAESRTAIAAIIDRLQELGLIAT